MGRENEVQEVKQQPAESGNAGGFEKEVQTQTEIPKPEDNSAIFEASNQAAAWGREAMSDVAQYQWHGTLRSETYAEGTNRFSDGGSAEVVNGRIVSYKTAPTPDKPGGYQYSGITYDGNGHMNGFTDPNGTRHEREEGNGDGWGNWTALKRDGKISRINSEYGMHSVDSTGFHDWTKSSSRITHRGDGGFADAYASSELHHTNEMTSSVTSGDGSTTTWTHGTIGEHGEVTFSGRVVTDDKNADKRIITEDGKIISVTKDLKEMSRQFHNQDMVESMAKEIYASRSVLGLEFYAKGLLLNGVAPEDIARRVNEEVQKKSPGNPFELKAGETKDGKTSFDLIDNRNQRTEHFEIENKNQESVKTDAEKKLDSAAKLIADRIKNGDPALAIGLHVNTIRKAFAEALDQPNLGDQRAVEALASKISKELSKLGITAELGHPAEHWGEVTFVQNGKRVGSTVEFGQGTDIGLSNPYPIGVQAR